MVPISESCALPRAEARYSTDSELAAILAAAGQRRTFPPGGRFFSAGDSAHGMYLIVQGTAQAELTVNGEEVLRRIAGPGAVMGMSSAMCSGHYKFDAVALEPVTGVFLQTADLNTLLRGNPELGLRVMNLMCDEMEALRQTRDRLRSCQRRECGLFEACTHPPAST
jgi:CRP-like cAMP-binding protein